jgi:3'5'-cyclic nucleotide phosphodiesterase
MSKKRNQHKDGSMLTYTLPAEMTYLDEFKEVIRMTTVASVCSSSKESTEDLEDLDDSLVHDLREYISILASMYRTNPFHNFEHACHVTMSVSKLLKRIVSLDLSDDHSSTDADSEADMHMHKCTVGISSDPLAQFAIVFSAIIHDVDHRGCSNVQLCKEQQFLGERYKHKSVAEQNSIALAWDLLMTPQFAKLREELFGNRAEMLRFRQIVINLVLATDIFDKELNDCRLARWKKVFSPSESTTDSGDLVDQLDRKTTIVIEHIIQASDVSHTMQHWHVYQKWNKNLFKEMYLAYQDGRMGADPSKFWYEGELAFFDNYIIPLAKKLKECQVFGVSSDEYLNYAGKLEVC